MSGEAKEDDEDCSGCLLVIAALCISFGVGSIYSTAHGFVAFGVVVLLLYVWALVKP